MGRSRIVVTEVQPYSLWCCGTCAVKRAHCAYATQLTRLWPQPFAVILDVSEHSGAHLHIIAALAGATHVPLAQWTHQLVSTGSVQGSLFQADLEHRMCVVLLFTLALPPSPTDLCNRGKKVWVAWVHSPPLRVAWKQGLNFFQLLLNSGVEKGGEEWRAAVQTF